MFPVANRPNNWWSQRKRPVPLPSANDIPAGSSDVPTNPLSPTQGNPGGPPVHAASTETPVTVLTQHQKDQLIGASFGMDPNDTGPKNWGEALVAKINNNANIPAAIAGVVGANPTGAGTGGSSTSDTSTTPYVANSNASDINGIEEFRRTLGKGAGTASNRLSGTVTPTNISTGQSDQDRQQMVDLINQLKAQASGNGPATPAQIQQQMMMNQAQAAARGVGAGSTNPALAHRLATNAVVGLSSKAAMDASLLRATEAQSAQQQLGQLQSGMRGQDIGLATNQAGLTQQGNITNLDASQRQKAMNDQMVQFYLQQGMSLEEAQTNANLEVQRINAGAVQSANTLAEDKNKFDSSRTDKWIDRGLTAAGTAFFSDERMKQDIQPASGDIQGFLDSLSAQGGAKKFQYKDPSISPGENFGVVAQDLEKSPVGSSLVQQDQLGRKIINVPKATNALLATNAHLNDRLNNTEQAIKDIDNRIKAGMTPKKAEKYKGFWDMLSKQQGMPSRAPQKKVAPKMNPVDALKAALAMRDRQRNERLMGAVRYSPIIASPGNGVAPIPKGMNIPNDPQAGMPFGIDLNSLSQSDLDYLDQMRLAQNE